MGIENMVGRTFVSVVGSKGDDEMRFTAEDGATFTFLHRQECCESVLIEDVDGDLDTLVGSPLLLADESTNQDNRPKYGESWTWTFYKFATVKGHITVRWLGQSNGYYGELVDLVESGP